ncbi:hypothetical protein HispidOSU_015794, partial [Sigmodon hispidus]
MEPGTVERPSADRGQGVQLSGPGHMKTKNTTAGGDFCRPWGPQMVGTIKANLRVGVGDDMGPEVKCATS